MPILINFRSLIIFVFIGLLQQGIMICSENSNIRKDNLRIIEELNKNFSVEISNQLSANNIKIKNLLFSQHSSTFFMENIISTEFSNKKLLTMDSNSLDLNINIIENNVYYNKVNNSKNQLLRTAKCKFQYSFKQNSEQAIFKGLSLQNNTYSKIVSDTVSLSEIEWLERSELPFASSPLPPEKKSFFDSYLTPIIAVSASILTAILLFTVRSK